MDAFDFGELQKPSRKKKMTMIFTVKAKESASKNEYIETYECYRPCTGAKSKERFPLLCLKSSKLCLSSFELGFIY